MSTIRRPYTESQRQLNKLIREKGYGTSITYTRMKPRDRFDKITEWKIYPLRRCNQPPNVGLVVANYAVELATGSSEETLKQWIEKAEVHEII